MLLGVLGVDFRQAVGEVCHDAVRVDADEHAHFFLGVDGPVVHGQVDTAHKHNLAVHYWTINDKDEMRMLIGIGADGIMTDFPHRLAEVYAEYTK